MERSLCNTIALFSGAATKPITKKPPGTKTAKARWSSDKPLTLRTIAMAPRAYWKGTLKLSLVSCPVVLYPASTAAAKTRFHLINKETGHRLKQQMIDAETG